MREGTIKLFMEYETLVETVERLARFADQLGVGEDELVEMFDRDWLPFITVVKLPDSLRRIDPRAVAVRERDPEDYAAAALAAALSPCIMLTHDVKHFAPLGVRDVGQGTAGISAAVSVRVGEVQFFSVMLVPSAPVIAVGAGIKLVADRVGPAGWLLAPVLAAGGYFLYRRQSPEKQQALREGAGSLGRYILEESSKAVAKTESARLALLRSAVPGPERRPIESAILRQLALALQPMSAHGLWSLLEEGVRPSEAKLRAFLREGAESGFFSQVDPGLFKLGRREQLPLG